VPAIILLCSAFIRSKSNSLCPNACSHSRAQRLPLKGSSKRQSYPECWLESVLRNYANSEPLQQVDKLPSGKLLAWCPILTRPQSSHVLNPHTSSILTRPQSSHVLNPHTSSILTRPQSSHALTPHMLHVSPGTGPWSPQTFHPPR
jgi:hypothetical protein